MAIKNTKLNTKPSKRVESRVKVERSDKLTSSTKKSSNIFDKLQFDINKERSYTNLVLGVLVVLVLGVLLFNFVSKQNFFGNNAGNLGPAQQAENTQQNQPNQDVAVNGLPGNYTVKEGDTLFQIAQKYYNDGDQFVKIAQANNIPNVNNLEVGQVLQLPKLDQAVAAAAITPSPSATTMADASPSPAASPDQMQAMNSQAQPTQQPNPSPNPADMGQGGAVNQTIWGEKINGTTYTVQAGDWLSKISGRAYGDIMQFNKIAAANHIADPNLIEPGTVLQIPR